MTTTTEFTTQQYDESYPAGIEHHFWNSARNSIIARALAQADMATGNLLEIGCGRGIVLEHLRRRGMECIGCELANAPVPEGLRPFVYTGTDFRSLPDETRKRIDGVLLCDVVEHIPDAGSFLGEIRTAFPRLRRVLVTVPARHELWSAWDEHYGHFRRYSPPHCATISSEAGSRRIQSDTFSTAFMGSCMERVGFAPKLWPTTLANSPSGDGDCLFGRIFIDAMLVSRHVAYCRRKHPAFLIIGRTGRVPELPKFRI